MQRRKYVTLFVKATSAEASGTEALAPQQGVLAAAAQDLQRPLGLLVALAAAMWLGMDASPAAGMSYATYA